MAWLGLERLLGNRKRRQADIVRQWAAIQQVQAVIEFDLQGHVLAANPNFLAVMGYRWDEIQGRHHAMFVEPAERESPRYREFWRQLGAGHHDAGRYRRLAKDGREVWLPASYRPALGRAACRGRVCQYR